MPRNKQDNLIPFAQRPEEEQRAIRSKGGRASVQKKREKKSIKELVDFIFSVPIKKGSKQLKLSKLKSLADLKDSNPTAAIAGIARLAQMVAQGNLKAIKLWFEISGEAKQNVNLIGSLDVTMKRDLSKLTDEDLYALANLVAKIDGGGTE